MPCFTEVIIMEENVILYRPVGMKELELMKDSAYLEFPPGLAEQPIFYPVLNEKYAIEIASQWNEKYNDCP